MWVGFALAGLSTLPYTRISVEVKALRSSLKEPASTVLLLS